MRQWRVVKADSLIVLMEVKFKRVLLIYRYWRKLFLI
jgi:hypothetical protein